MDTGRPIVKHLERSRFDVALEAVAFAGLVFLIGISTHYYSALPATIPTHFNFKGEPDGWGGKGTLLLLPAIGVILYLGLTVLSRFPHLFNYPGTITESNASRQYGIARQLISAVKVSLVVTFSYITWAMIQTARGIQNGLSPSFALIESPVLFAIIGFYIFKARKAR